MEKTLMLGKTEGPQYGLELCGSTYMGIFVFDSTT